MKIKKNNSLDNLMVFKTKADHAAFHKGCDIVKDGDVYVALPHKDFTANVCVDCYRKNRHTTERPDRNTLKYLIYNKSFTFIGRMFGVSDNAIRKWCKVYNLPSKKTIIDSYSEKEWEFI